MNFSDCIVVIDLTLYCKNLKPKLFVPCKLNTIAMYFSGFNKNADCLHLYGFGYFKRPVKGREILYI